MFLLELATQGVKGCSPSSRTSFSPNYVAVQPPAGAPVAFAGLLTALLFPEGRGEDAQFAAAPKGKAALTLQGADLTTFRIVRELGGPGVLQRLNRSAQAFETVSKEPQEIVSALRAALGLPHRTAFERLYTLSAAQLPTRAAVVAARTVSASERAEAQARLAALEQELALSTEIDQLQFRLDGLASEGYEVEARVKSLDGLRDQVAHAQAAFDAAPTPQSLGLSDDLVERAERHSQMVQKRDDALLRLQQERENAQQAAPSSVEPLYRDLRFLGGVGMGVAALGGALFLGGMGRYLALLDIPAFGFAALVALQWIDDLQGAQRSTRKEDFLAAREKKIHDDFELEQRPLHAAMKALGVDSVGDVVEALRRKARIGAELEALQARLAEAEADPDFVSARTRHETLKAEQDAITQELRARSGGYVRDPREVEREIERVKASIDPARSVPAASDAVARPADPAPGLLEAATEVLGIDLATLTGTLKDRCSQYLAALTDRRYVGVGFDAQGRATLTTAEGALAVDVLPPTDVDLLYLALRLTIAEKGSARLRLPLIIDDVVGELVDAAKLPLLGRMLKHLGTLTQVVQVTSAPGLTAMADTTASL